MMGPPIRLSAEQAPRARYAQVWSVRPGVRVTIVTAAPPGDPITDQLLASQIIPAMRVAGQLPKGDR